MAISVTVAATCPYCNKTGAFPLKTQEMSGYDVAWCKNTACKKPFAVYIESTITTRSFKLEPPPGTPPPPPPPPTADVQVLFPNASGLSFKRGSLVNITWASSTRVGTGVKIALQHAGRYKTITPEAPNTGLYAWMIPADQETGDDFLLSVSSLNEVYYDYSDNTFKITA